MSKGKEFLKERIISNVKQFLDDGFQQINITVNKNGFIINPTKKMRNTGGQSK